MVPPHQFVSHAFHNCHCALVQHLTRVTSCAGAAAVAASRQRVKAAASRE
jgi:hypothetical protein